MRPIDFEIRYFTKANGAQIAYGRVGSGPAVIFPPAWLSLLNYPVPDPFTDLFSQDFELINYDLEGTGLSSGTSRLVEGQERHADELVEFLDHLGIERAVLLGKSLAGPTVLDFAARYPDRVAAVLMIGGYAKGPGLFNPKMVAAFPPLVRANWGMASKALMDMFQPESTTEEREHLALVQRLSSDAETAAGLLEELYAADVEDRLPLITAPTLVFHYRDDRAIPFRGGQQVAERVPNARLVALVGTTHQPQTEAESRVVVDAMRDFIREHAPAAGVSTDERDVAPPPAEQLTARERQVLELVAAGLGNAAIAVELSVSVRTIERHLSNLYGKLGVQNRAQATGYAIRNGLAH